MASSPLLYPAQSWNNQEIVLYHGTVDTYADAMVSGSIDVSYGKPFKDFGPGFYTTTLRRQAEFWANLIAGVHRDASAAIVEVVLSRNALSQMSTLGFVRGDFDADDFWSFVSYCREGALDHGLASSAIAPAKLYDVVYGPVTADWTQRATFNGADQISFHTSAAQILLNEGSRRRIQ